MAGNKYDKKMRILPLLPYGFCSQVATTIIGKSNPYATTTSLGSTPEATIAGSEKYREKVVERARYMRQIGIVKDTSRTCGTPSKPRQIRQITKKGLAALTEAPDSEDWNEDNEGTNDGLRKDTYFRSNSQAATDLRDNLHEYAISDYEGDQQAFADLLLESVKKGVATPFAYATDLARRVHIGTTKYSQNQIYNIWRLSHVNAMFRVNGYLTNLDRRPYDTHFLIDGINSADSYNRYIEKHGHTVASLTYYVLSHWYADNPGIYKIDQQYPDTSDEARQEWLHTPAFYSTRELPIFDAPEKTESMGSKKKLNSIFIGLAMGRKVNYLCYHRQGGQIKWIASREKASKAAVRDAMREMKRRNPEMSNRETLDYALYFCTSHYQFTALFDRTIDRHKRGLTRNYLTDDPFTGIHAIPVNDTGTFLLWCLMEMSPMETEMRICNNLVNQDIGFEHQVANRIYPLTYKGKRVFTGYAMDIKKINRALDDYLDGQNFYIVCFPEQVVWYKKLFPTLTFL